MVSIREKNRTEYPKIREEMLKKMNEPITKLPKRKKPKFSEIKKEKK